jgi:hypothetical protein
MNIYVIHFCNNKLLSLSLTLFIKIPLSIRTMCMTHFFDIVLANATASVFKFDWQMLPSAETHHLRAVSRITEELQTGEIKSLQAILLLFQYRTGSSMQDTSASASRLVGIVVRICFELGLHRESIYIERPGSGKRRLLAGFERATATVSMFLGCLCHGQVYICDSASPFRHSSFLLSFWTIPCCTQNWFIDLIISISQSYQYRV